jgi:hypothetical protein
LLRKKQNNTSYYFAPLRLCETLSNLKINILAKTQRRKV